MQRAARQEQFLEVVDRAEAEARFRRHLVLAPLGEEVVSLIKAAGRVLSRDVVAGIDVPGFDRSSMDGFAVRAADTAGASSEQPRLLRLNREILTPGVEPRITVAEGTATIIATGGMLPRGADAIVMVEDTDTLERAAELLVEVRRPVPPGQSVAVAGGDIARGETLFRAGQILSSREIGSLAADRSGRGLRVAQTASRDLFDRRRTHHAGRGDASGRRLRFQPGDPGGRGRGTGRSSGSAGNCPR